MHVTIFPAKLLILFILLNKIVCAMKSKKNKNKTLFGVTDSNI